MSNPRITLATRWLDAKGREWEVYELLPFGRARVRCGSLLGEMRHSDIRAEIGVAQ